MLSTLDTLKDFIETNIESAMSIIEARNGITITPYLVLRTFTPLGKQFPSISILPSDTDSMIEGAGNRPFFGNPTTRDDIVLIQVWDRGNPDQSRTTETNVVGYMDSLEELFKGDYELDGIRGVDIMETTYTDLFPDISRLEQRELLKGATLRLRVKYRII